MKSYRCSSLPILFACPSSQQDWQAPIHPQFEGGRIGSALHEAMRRFTVGEDRDDITDSLLAIVNEERADYDEVSRLFARGRICWMEIQQRYNVRAEEVERQRRGMIGDVQLTGRVDVEAWRGDQPVVVVDWKSGRMASDYYWQMQGYCWLSETPYAAVCDLREREYDIIEALPPETFAERFTNAVAKVGKLYNPGEHCALCPGIYECAARRGAITSTVSMFLESTHTHAIDHRDQIAKAYPFVKQLEQAIERYRAYARMEVERSGPIDIGDGYELALVTQGKRVIHPKDAWPVLMQRLTDDQLAECIKISITALESVVRAGAKRGQKGAAVTALLDELRVAGAVEVKESTQCRKRKKMA